MKKLSIEFYKGKDVVKLAKALIGKVLVTKFKGQTTSGRIVETEAYIGLTDKASHSFGGRRTARNEHMYASPGISYVYICYGMHHLFNVVTNKKNIPDAILIRALDPLLGIETMLRRTEKKKLDNTLTKGPGNAAKALGILKEHSGIPLVGNKIFVATDEHSSYYQLPGELIGTSKRIGVESSGESALLPFRFYVKGNKFVSGSPTR